MYLAAMLMSTIHPLSGEDSLVLRMRKHPGNKSTNASGVNPTFLPGERQKELDIPVLVDAYNKNKEVVDVADLYRTYFDTQLISRCNLYPLFYWILETAFINSLIIYQDLPVNKERTVENFDFHLCIVHDHLPAGSPSTTKSSSRILASQNITRSAPATQCALPPLSARLVTKHTPLPLSRKVPGMHSPLWMQSRVGC